MHFIRVWNCVSNPIVSIALCKVCIITLLPHDGMSNPFLWQAFSIFLIFRSLTCDSTPAALDWFRWGRRLGGGKKEGCKGRKRAFFLRSPWCNPDGSIWLWAGDQMINQRKCHRVWLLRVVRVDVAVEVPCPVPSRWKRWFGEGITIPGAFSMLTLPVLLLLVQLNYWDGKPGAKKSSVGNIQSLLRRKFFWQLCEEGSGNQKLELVLGTRLILLLTHV